MIDHSINVHDSLADGGEEAKSATIVNMYLYSLDTIYYLTLCDCDDLVKRQRERERDPGRKGGSNTRGEVNRPGIEITYLGL